MPSLPDPAPPVRAEFSIVDLVHDPATLRVADLCAWLADSPDNTPEDYPGPGWDDPACWPTWTDADRWALSE